MTGDATKSGRIGLGALGFAVGFGLLACVPAYGRGIAPAREPTTSPYLPEAEAAPATTYARLDRETCLGELTRRAIPFRVEGAVLGVVAPVRLTGTLQGVHFHGVEPERKRASSPFEIFDCRLVLALNDLAGVLARHDVVEVVHMSAYRPPPKNWPAGKVASRHGGALALDMGAFVKRDGTSLRVERDFHGRVGARTCGRDASPYLRSPESTELRDIVCEASERRLFNVALTPNYNRAHRDHFHMEVTAGVKWFLIH